MQMELTLKKLLFVFLLVFLGYWIGMGLVAYVNAGLGALLFYFFLREPVNQLVEKRKWKIGKAVWVTLLISFMVVMLPLGIFIGVVGTKISSISLNLQETSKAITAFINQIEHQYQIEILSAQNLEKLMGFASSWLGSSVGIITDSLGSVVVMYFLLYYMLLDYRAMELWFVHELPLSKQSIRLMGRELKQLVVSNALGIPLTALAQGLLAWICYMFLSVDDTLFWFVLTAFSAMIPFVGAALGYVPLSILLYTEGHETQAWVLLIYGVVVIGMADNLVRMFFQKRMGNVHPLITVLGVIVGLQIFGFLGLIFGPILLSIFILLFKVYQVEFGKLNGDEAG